jgi:D-isomer specific 2-hydroxyacid dehydrogenase-like protein
MITKKQQSLMEVTGALSSCARSAGFNFGPDTALVAVQHMLYQTVDLFRAAGQMGLEPQNIFALGKVYSNSVPVMRTIRNMGATVVESTLPAPGEFDDAFNRDIELLWATVTGKLAQRAIKRIIVLDDGGRCVINIPRDLLSRYAVAGVEQTSLGMFLFEENPPPFAVFSWARAAVKLQIGGHIFSHCFIDRVQTEFLRGNSLRGAEIGIIGLGSIGRSLADIASQQGNRVVFYDPAADLKVPCYLRRRITRVNSLEELMLRSDYVFGSSGRNPFKGRWPMVHRPGIKLFSSSGGDQEFGPVIRHLRTCPNFSVAASTWDITSEHGPSAPLRIAYMGFPYNFVSRAEAAVPTHIVQLETAGLLCGLIQARSYLELVEDGQDQDTRIHRISPEAQGFIYDLWLQAMKKRGIDIRSLYGYDTSLLAATQRSGWFAEHTEPRPQATDGSGDRVEEMMRSILAASG